MRLGLWIPMNEDQSLLKKRIKVCSCSQTEGLEALVASPMAHAPHAEGMLTRSREGHLMPFPHTD